MLHAAGRADTAAIHAGAAYDATIFFFFFLPLCSFDGRSASKHNTSTNQYFAMRIATGETYDKRHVARIRHVAQFIVAARYGALLLLASARDKDRCVIPCAPTLKHELQRRALLLRYDIRAGALRYDSDDTLLRCQFAIIAARASHFAGVSCRSCIIRCDRPLLYQLSATLSLLDGVISQAHGIAAYARHAAAPAFTLAAKIRWHVALFVAYDADAVAGAATPCFSLRSPLRYAACLMLMLLAPPLDYALRHFTLF